MLKNNWVYSFLVGLIISISLMAYFTTMQNTLFKDPGYDVITMPLFFVSHLSIFIIGVLRVKYNSYKKTFYSGLRISIFTSVFGFISFCFTSLLVFKVSLSRIDLSGVAMTFFKAFIALIVLSALLPFIRRKYWGKLDDSFKDKSVLDS
tara:strand:- start:14 stop:460 length:447 start_codon:yes stop_codon:yes gene_type:complete